METNLCIKIVSQAVQELTLDGILLGQQGQVMAQLVMSGDDSTLSKLIKLGSTSSAENLHDIQDT